MALSKEGYRSAVRGVAYTDVALNADGFIASASDTATDNKALQMSMVNAGNSQAQNQALTDIFLGFVDNYRAGSSYRMRVIWEV